MNAKKFFKAVIGTFSTEIGIHILQFVTTVFIVRNLSATDFGIFSLLLSFSITLCYLSGIGLPQAVIYFIGKQKEPLGKVVANYLFLFCCISLSVLVFAYLLQDYPLNSFLQELPRHYVLPLLIMYFFLLLDAFLLSIIRGLKNFLLFNVRRFLTPVVKLLGFLLIFIFSEISLQSAVFVFMLVNVVLTTFFFIKVISAISFQLNLDRFTMAALLKYGIKSYLQTLTGHLVYQVDLYIIAYLLGAEEVAFYGIAVGVATLLWYLPNTIGTVLFPTLSSLHNEKEIHAFSAQICRNTLLITGLAAIVLGFVGKHLILFFYGSKYIQSVNAMLIILPGIVIMSIYKVLTRNFSSRNRQQVSVVAAGVALIVNICLNFIWIPTYGIEGAALASTVSYILAGIILIVKVKMESALPFRKMLLIDKSDIKFYIKTISQLHKNM